MSAASGAELVEVAVSGQRFAIGVMAGVADKLLSGQMALSMAAALAAGIAGAWLGRTGAPRPAPANQM